MTRPKSTPSLAVVNSTATSPGALGCVRSRRRRNCAAAVASVDHCHLLIYSAIASCHDLSLMRDMVKPLASTSSVFSLHATMK